MTKIRQPFTKPFPGRVEHYVDEPAYSLLVRTATHNGLRHVYTLFTRCGIVKGQGVSDVDPVTIARLCGHDRNEASVARIVHATPQVTPADVSLFGERVARDHFSVVNRRWCPDCMAESPYHRAFWDVAYFGACPDHGVKIVEDCGCDRRPAWKMSYPLRCTEGHRFDEAPRVPASPPEILLSAYVRDRLLGRERAPTLAGDMSTLGDALTVMDRLGQASLGEAKGLIALRRDFGRAGVAAEGFRILSDFPAAFGDLLDRLLLSRETRKGPRQWGTENAYGSFYTWVANSPDGNPFAAKMKAAMASHASRHVVLKTGTTVAGIVVEQQPGVDLMDAADRAGMTFERFRRIATVMGVLPRKDLRGRPARLSEEVLDDMLGKLRGHKTREQIADELAIAPHVAGVLIRDKLLPAIVDGKTDPDNRLNIWLLKPTAATDLVARLTADAPTGVPISDSLAPISLAARIVRVPLSRVIQLVLAGDLKVRAHVARNTGLLGVYVSKTDLKIAMRKTRVPGFTLTEAASEIGVHPESMPELRRAGLVQCTKIGSVYSVTFEEIARFRAKYVTTSELAVAMGAAGAQSVPALLADVGLDTVCARPKFRQFLYDRKDAQAAVLRYKAKREAAFASVQPYVDGIDRARAAPLMGIAPQLLTQLVDAKKVPATITNRGFVLDKTVVMTFRRDYVSAFDLAPLLGTEGAAALRPVLKQAGVAPFCGRPEFYAFVYPRREATAAVKVAAAARVASGIEEARISTRITKTLDPIATWRRLGVSDTMLKQMRIAGLIKSEKIGRKFRYAEDEVARFETTYVAGGMLRQLCGDREVGDGNAMTMVLLNAGLKPVCERPKFYTFLFWRGAAQAAIDDHFKRIDDATAAADKPRTAITLRAVQERLHMTTNMGSALVRAGLLKADVRASTILIEPGEVDRFNARYVTARETADAMMDGAGPKVAVSLLDKLGVSPIEESSLLPTALYDRGRVINAMNAWRNDPSIAQPVRHRSVDELLTHEVRNALRCSDPFMKEIVEAGLLPSQTRGCARVIMANDLKAFQAKYMLPVELLEHFECRHARKAGNRLRDMGVQVVTTKPALSARLYLRAEVEKALARSGRQQAAE